MKIMSREDYDEANGYAMTMYRSENWEAFNRNQIKEMAWFQGVFQELGHIPQVQKIAVMNHEDFLSKKNKIESEEGFVKWFD